jgi:signal peptidase I
MIRNELAVIIAKVIENRGAIDVTCYGDAMFPLLRDGNVTTFVRVREEELQIGDVCLFETNEGHLLLYRMIDIDDEQQPAMYTFRGDTCDIPQQPVPYSHIIGKLKAVHRDGKVLYVNHWRSRLLEAAVLQIPFWSKFSRWMANRRYDRASAI